MCKLSRIMFQLPTDQVPDWDDRMRTVKWVDVLRNTPGTLAAKRKVSGDIRYKSDQACHGWLCLLLSGSVSHHFLHSWTKKIVSHSNWPWFDLDFRSDRLNLQACHLPAMRPTHLDPNSFSLSLDTFWSKFSHHQQNHVSLLAILVFYLCPEFD